MLRRINERITSNTYDQSTFMYELPRKKAPPIIVPTITISDTLEINPVEGVKLTVYHAPGETNDQINVWWPDRKILFPGDNFYKAFPNLYAIRGTSTR